MRWTGKGPVRPDDTMLMLDVLRRRERWSREYGVGSEGRNSERCAMHVNTVGMNYGLAGKSRLLTLDGKKGWGGGWESGGPCSVCVGCVW